MFKFNGYIKENIMSVDLMKKRLMYYNGNQQQRMITDKLRSLKKALLYSYQAATAILPDNRQFRCLINPDKTKPAYDNKIISIPYKDICLNAPRVGKTSEGQVEIGLKPGQVFTWKETDTHWLVYLEDIEEDAYFRAEIRRCEAKATLADGSSYWVYIRGPVETSIQWFQKSQVEWNSLNYSLVIFITADDKTCEQIERFAKIKIYDSRKKKDKTWQVVGVDEYYGDGILQVFLDEFFENSIEEAAKEEKEKENPINDPAQGVPYIDGPKEISQYSIVKYTIKNATGGSWYAQESIKTFNEETEEQQIKIQQTLLAAEQDTLSLNSFGRKSGEFILIYRIQGEQDITLKVKLVPL